MCPLLTTQCFSRCLPSEATGVSLYFEDDLTSGTPPSRHQTLEMESLPSIVFGPMPSPLPPMCVVRATSQVEGKKALGVDT